MQHLFYFVLRVRTVYVAQVFIIIICIFIQCHYMVASEALRVGCTFCHSPKHWREY